MHDVAAHAAGEVDDDVSAALADALDHLAVVTVSMLNAPVSGSRTWMWTMAAPACAASMASLRDLLGRDCAVGALGDLGVVAGHGTGDESTSSS